MKPLMYCLMFYDHAMAVFVAGSAFGRLPARIVFPYFAALTAMNTLKSSNAKNYMERLLMLGILSQIPYMLALKTVMPNDVLYLALISYFVQRSSNSKLNSFKMLVVGSESGKSNILNFWKKYWLYSVYPLHLLIIYGIRQISI